MFANSSFEIGLIVFALIFVLLSLLYFILFHYGKIILKFILEEIYAENFSKDLKIFVTILAIFIYLVLMSIYSLWSYNSISNFEIEIKDFEMERIEIHSEEYYKIFLESDVQNSNYYRVKNYIHDVRSGMIKNPVLYQSHKKVRPKIVVGEYQKFKKAKIDVYFGDETIGNEIFKYDGQNKLFLLFPIKRESEKIKIDYDSFEIIYNVEKDKLVHFNKNENFIKNRIE